MVHDYSWWAILCQLIGINIGLWAYNWAHNKVFKTDRPYSANEAANVTIGFVLCAILFKWGW